MVFNFWTIQGTRIVADHALQTKWGGQLTWKAEYSVAYSIASREYAIWAVYEYSVEGGLRYRGRRIARTLHLEFPISGNQIVLDVLMHFFGDDIDSEHRAYALHSRIKPYLVTRFVKTDWEMSESELAEIVTLTLCQQWERVHGRSDLNYL